MMLYPTPPPAGFAFHVVEVMSSARYHLKRKFHFDRVPVLISNRVGIHGGSDGVHRRDRGGSFDD